MSPEVKDLEGGRACSTRENMRLACQMGFKRRQKRATLLVVNDQNLIVKAPFIFDFQHLVLEQRKRWNKGSIERERRTKISHQRSHKSKIL